MKKIKATLSALALSMILCAPVVAQPHTPVISNTLSAHDLEMAFENAGEPMDLALLSEQEMAETKGAVWPTVTVRAFWGGASYGNAYALTTNHGAYRWSGASEWILRGMILGALAVTPAAGVITVPLDIYMLGGAGEYSWMSQLTDYTKYGPSYR